MNTMSSDNVVWNSLLHNLYLSLFVYSVIHVCTWCLLDICMMSDKCPKIDDVTKLSRLYSCFLGKLPKPSAFCFLHLINKVILVPVENISWIYLRSIQISRSRNSKFGLAYRQLWTWLTLIPLGDFVQVRSVHKNNDCIQLKYLLVNTMRATSNVFISSTIRRKSHLLHILYNIYNVQIKFLLWSRHAYLLTAMHTS